MVGGHRRHAVRERGDLARVTRSTRDPATPPVRDRFSALEAPIVVSLVNQPFLMAQGTTPGRQAPPDLDQFIPDQVLRQLPGWGWTMVAYGGRTRPDPLVAHYLMPDVAYVDVLVLRGRDRCGAYRARIWPGQDPLDVYAVTWSDTGHLRPVLWELLNLPPVQLGWRDYPHPTALRAPLPVPETPRTIRPPQ